MTEVSEFFTKRYRQIASDFEVPDSSIRQAIRVNTHKITANRLVWALTKKKVRLTKISWLKNGYWAESEFSLGSTPEYLQGHYYIQGPLSQLACELLNPVEKSTVLDMAAAPGSKTTYLAQLVGEKGIVIAIDLDATRLQSVRNNAERLGLANVVCVRRDARFSHDLGKKFDFILLDAPCAGNFCSEDNWSANRTIDDFKKNARLQRELMTSAYKSLAPGGRIIYSTCSLEPEEDELIIDWALKRFPDLDVVPIDTELGDSGTTEWEGEGLDPRIAETKRFWPHKTGEEGFYIALLEKKDES